MDVDLQTGGIRADVVCVMDAVGREPEKAPLESPEDDDLMLPRGKNRGAPFLLAIGDYLKTNRSQRSPTWI